MCLGSIWASLNSTEKGEMNTSQKSCTICSKTFPATREFFGHYARNGNFKPNCRECEREKVKTWRKNNPEKAKAGYKLNQKRRSGFVPSAELEVQLFTKADSKCRYCQASLGTDAQVG